MYITMFCHNNMRRTLNLKIVDEKKHDENCIIPHQNSNIDSLSIENVQDILKTNETSR